MMSQSPATKDIVFSGIQPTGILHIGNYFGAIRFWLDVQEDPQYQTFFSIVDLHAITIPYSPDEFHQTVMSTFTTLLACGIDVQKSVFFIQSHVPEHIQLAWLLSCVTPYGDLTRMTQFKDKSMIFSQSINLGLFSYPVLMAADILLYGATIVPVGQDQLQHLELTREIARRFNDRFGKEIFSLPHSLLKAPLKLKGLDGENKMSKSLHNFIGLTESYQDIQSKIRGAKTDPARVHKSDPGHPDICNIYSYHQFFSSKEEQNFIFEDCSQARIGCSDCKSTLIKNLWDFLEPIGERKRQIEKNPQESKELIHLGQEKARRVASERHQHIAQIMGF